MKHESMNIRRLIRANRLLAEQGHAGDTLGALDELAALRKDAERYRWLKYSESLAWPSVDLANACHRAAREDRDDLIDAEIDRQMAWAAAGAA